jgi:hypothetical protein
LPISYCGILSIIRSVLAKPEDAGAKVRLGGSMFKKQACFAVSLREIEVVIHYDENVDVVGMRF